MSKHTFGAAVVGLALFAGSAFAADAPRLDHPVYAETLRAEIAKLAVERATLASRYRDAHPAMQANAASLTSLSTRFDQAEGVGASAAVQRAALEIAYAETLTMFAANHPRTRALKAAIQATTAK